MEQFFLLFPCVYKKHWLAKKSRKGGWLNVSSDNALHPLKFACIIEPLVQIEYCMPKFFSVESTKILIFSTLE